jgi:hypothetical protein
MSYSMPKKLLTAAVLTFEKLGCWLLDACCQPLNTEYCKYATRI